MTTGSAGLLKPKNELIRKGLTGGVFIAPITAAEITAAVLFDATTGALNNPLPAGYLDLGLLTDVGVKFARAVKSTDILSWQSLDPTRTDITSDITTMVLEPQECNQTTIATYLNVDPSALTPGTNGAFEVDRPDTSIPRYMRVLVLSVDEGEFGEIVYARFVPKALVTTFNDQIIANGASALTWGVTMQAYTDSVLGYPEKFLFGGEGQLPLVVDMGFSRAITATVALTTDLVATVGNFYPNDVGAVVVGAGLAGGQKIAAYVSPTEVTLDSAGTVAAAGVAVTLDGKA